MILLLALLLAQADNRVKLCDKADAKKCATVNASGQVSISGAISASTTGRATAAAPSYVEGTDNPLSIDLTGNIRTLATATTAATATAANPSYTEGSTSAISQDLSGHLRNACTQAGTWTVQPGNTANTTAWKVDGSAVTQPVSGTFWQATQPVSGTFWQATQPVAGPDATGAARTGNPVVGGVVDSSGNVQAMRSFAAASGVLGTTMLTASGTQIVVNNGGTNPTAGVAVAGTDGTNGRVLKTATDGSLRIDPTGVTTQPAGGNVASGATDSGNPVKTGGVFNTTQPTVTNGQRVDFQATARGAQIVATGVDALTVAGTVTTTPPTNASTNVAQLAGTATDTNSGSKSAGTLRVVIATDQPQLTNKLLVTPDSVALPANQSVNVAQVAGTTTDTNSGSKSAGTMRVVLATDQPALTNKLLVTPDSVALPANQSVNVAQFGGTNTVTGTGAGGSGIPRVTISNDSSLAANQSVSLAQVGGTNTVNGGLAGSLSIGGTAGNNAAITQNPLVIGVEARSSTPTAATNGNQIRAGGDLAGNQFSVSPIAWTCNLQALAASLTQCQAAPAAGYSLYVTAIIATTTTTTAGTFAVRYGTGSNCATTPIGVWPQPGGSAPSRVVTAPISTAAPMVINLGPVGWKVAAANAVCVIGTATNTIDISLMGYTAP